MLVLRGQRAHLILIILLRCLLRSLLTHQIAVVRLEHLLQVVLLLLELVRILFLRLLYRSHVICLLCQLVLKRRHSRVETLPLVSGSCKAAGVAGQTLVVRTARIQLRRVLQRFHALTILAHLNLCALIASLVVLNLIQLLALARWISLQNVLRTVHPLRVHVQIELLRLR